MKDIIFINDNFLVGGTNTSAITQLNLLIEMGYSVTLWVVTGVYDEEMIDQIPSGVSVVCGSEFDRLYKTQAQISRIKRVLKHPYKMARRMLIKRDLGTNSKLHNRREAKYGTLADNYSLAFYFDLPLMTNYLNWIDRQINCKKKVLWIHTVYANKTILATFNLKEELSISTLDKFDKIFAVSKECKLGFVSFFEKFDINVDIIRLPLDVKKIKKMALEQTIDMESQDLRLITVGRITYEKGIDRIITICKNLLSEKIKFVWYVIGDGDMETEISSMIKENNLEESLLLLGRKPNPYPYLLNADIVVVPSRTESWGLVTNEALILGRPIVATDVGGTKEMLTNYFKGEVVENHQDRITEGIKSIITRSKNNYNLGGIAENRFDETFAKKCMNEILQLVENE